MLCILHFLSGSCSKTEISEQLYYFKCYHIAFSSLRGFLVKNGKSPAPAAMKSRALSSGSGLREATPFSNPTHKEESRWPAGGGGG
jgi:hypothetical protein